MTLRLPYLSVLLFGYTVDEFNFNKLIEYNKIFRWGRIFLLRTIWTGKYQLTMKCRFSVSFSRVYRFNIPISIIIIIFLNWWRPLRYTIAVVMAFDPYSHLQCVKYTSNGLCRTFMFNDRLFGEKIAHTYDIPHKMCRLRDIDQYSSSSSLR